MTTERFYRGGERSQFRVNYTDGAVAANAQRGRANLITVTPATQVRVKRLAVTVRIAKSSSAVQGWLAFLRVADASTVDISAVPIEDPSVLRPKVFITNADHAIYVELYLEAINMDGGEGLFLLAYADATATLPYVAKWYSDANIR